MATSALSTTNNTNPTEADGKTAILIYPLISVNFMLLVIIIIDRQEKLI